MKEKLKKFARKITIGAKKLAEWAKTVGQLLSLAYLIKKLFRMCG